MLIALASVATGMGYSPEQAWSWAEVAARQPDEKTAFFEMHRLVTSALVEANFG